ncbi:dorsal-ventral patterning protein Sog isoform X2 [Thrips palmi]|nr:dorsal-ventral patterning protein Sog isoform X2 [Thrips palmi]
MGALAALQWVALVALLVLLDPRGAAARMQSPSGNPLIDDSVRGHHKPNPRAAECVFGKQTRELGSTWFADLGPPFGVMYCIRCECIPIQKKRRIVARVQCRNIKHECPEPTCDEPVLLPNRCCKVCPGDVGMHSPDIVQDVAPTVSAEEEDKNWKHFAALLTGRTSRLLAHAVQGSGLVAPPRNVGGHVATARFTFHRKSLYYSVLTPRRPRAIQFVDREGSILEEQAVPAQGSAYQNATGKVCGVWRRLSRDYRRLLREERLLVTLLWDNDDSVTGSVQRARSLGSELLSALLLPVHGNNSPASEPQNPLAGAGGTAIVSISSSGPSVHIALLFNGIFSPQDILDVPVSVRLETADGSRQVLEETVRVAKPGAELNEASVTAAVSAADLRLLTRGKLVLTVASASPRRPRDLALAGAVQPRAVCEIFQAPLSVAEATADQQEEAGNAGNSSVAVAEQASDNKDRPAGQAWLYVDRHGALVYSVQLSQVPGETTLLTLVSGRGRRSVELEDLTPSLHAPLGSWGWANGSVSRLSPRELEQLYAGELSVNVATGAAASLVRGRLVARPVADARDAPQPTLLTPKMAPTGSTVRIAVKGPAANLTGMAWFAVDQDCNLNYDVSLSPGSPTGTPSSPLQLALEQVPFLALGAPVSRRVLDEFTTPQHEGTGIALTHAELSRLDAGVSYVDIVLPDGGAELRAELRQVRVPAFCLPHYSDNDVPSSSSMASAGQPSNGEPETLHCFHETRFYEDGAQWVSAQDACTMCSCHRARVQCDAVVCPPLHCAAPAPAAPGQCCGTCAPAAPAQPDPVTAVAAAAAPAGCKLGGQFHAAGTSWHPYVPPIGFDTCAVCTCNASTLETRCERTQCPPLSCSEHEAVRAEPRACCKQCPKSAPVAAAANGGLPQLQAEQAAPKTVEEVLAEGGCKNPLGKPHSNGDEWHPRISSHGEYKCVKCRCKDGKVKCDRKRCTRSACEGQHAHQALRRSSALHTPLHALHAPREDACCMAQCRRFRRHHNKAKTEARAESEPARSEPRNEPRNEPRR